VIGDLANATGIFKQLFLAFETVSFEKKDLPLLPPPQF
jgi:hypothetical protein